MPPWKLFGSMKNVWEINCLFMLTTRKTWKLHITSPLWGESNIGPVMLHENVWCNTTTAFLRHHETQITVNMQLQLARITSYSLICLSTSWYFTLVLNDQHPLLKLSYMLLIWNTTHQSEICSNQTQNKMVSFEMPLHVKPDQQEQRVYRNVWFWFVCYIWCCRFFICAFEWRQPILWGPEIRQRLAPLNEGRDTCIHHDTTDSHRNEPLQQKHIYIFVCSYCGNILLFVWLIIDLDIFLNR